MEAVDLAAVDSVEVGTGKSSPGLRGRRGARKRLAFFFCAVLMGRSEGKTAACLLCPE